MFDENMDIPSWLIRASSDEWNFGIILKNGLKIGFGSCGAKLEGDGKIWLHLSRTDFEGDMKDGCLELNERGMWVRLDDISAFWERATT